MSVTQVPLRPLKRGSLARLAIGLILLVAAGIALAWIGAGSLRGETLPGGVVVRTVSAGDGPKIRPNDGVMIDYEGRLPDGRVFDSSAGRGPAPMIAGQVIPGFAQALQQMQNGGRYKIRIPAALGYGASPPPGSPIPPNADLDFDVHVARVVPDAALMTGPPGGAGDAPQPGM